MLDVAVRQERITRNVARGANPPEIRHKEAAFFERDDVDRIIEAVPEQYRASSRSRACSAFGSARRRRFAGAP